MSQEKNKNIKEDNNKLSKIDKLFLKRIKDLKPEEQKMLLELYQEIQA